MAASPPALKPSDFHLLLALLDRPLHGYALSRRMEEESEGQVRMLPGNLYAVLRRLVGEGLVTETDERPAEDRTDARRRYFAITSTGRDVLVREARRLSRTTDLLTARLREAGVAEGEMAP